MLLKIPNVLDASAVERVRGIIDASEWVDGNETSGHQSRLAKRNQQLREGCDEANRAGQIVLDALARAGEFVAAALPLKVFPPLFNRYRGGEEFGSHIDNGIRALAGEDFRIRSDLSCTLFLEPPEAYDGGELIVQDLFGEQAIKLNAGDMVLYPASSVHRVTPVTRGARTACFFWLQSMVRDNGEREELYRLDRTIRSLSEQCGAADPAIIELTGHYHNLLRRWADV